VRNYKSIRDKNKVGYNRFGKAFSISIILLMIFGIFNAMAPPHRQYNIFGTAYEGIHPPGTVVTNGNGLSAWIDGECYGNTTVLPSDMYDLYVDGDYWGTPYDDAVKDGGYDGDSIMYFLNYNPIDYFLNVSHKTSSYSGGGYEGFVDLFFNRTDLAPGLTTLRMLKINEIVLDPSDGLSQYVIIYDPGQHLGMNNITDYYIQKDNNVTHTTEGEKYDFLTHVNDISDMGNGYFYINLVNDLYLNESDEVKLVWKSPYFPNADPLLTGPGNGTDIIVDRVEWGNYENQHAGDYTWRDYDNTTILDFLDVSELYGTGASMIRTDNKTHPGYSGNGTDTDNCFADFKVLYTKTQRPEMKPVFNEDSLEYFDTIQAGIDDPDTMDGHTITGVSGLYNEDVMVNKNISLIGADRTTTIIQGTVTIDNASVDLQKFKIEKPGGTSLLLMGASFTNIQDLMLEDNLNALVCEDSHNVTIQDCLIKNNAGNGIQIVSSTDVWVYHNNIINNVVQAFDDGSNHWDNGYPSGGNFWSDYSGYDLYSGSNQDIPGNDAVGDTENSIDIDSVDNYPLKNSKGDCIFLYHGWNHVSLPFIQSDTNLFNVLESIGDSYNKVQAYDENSPSHPWKHYNSQKPKSLNSLSQIDHKYGFWIHIKDPDGVLFIYSGLQPTEDQTVIRQ
jgi:parallel beta-helix repeat protein